MTIIDLETALGKQQNDAPKQAQTRDENNESAQVHGSRPETPNNRDVREGTPLSVTPSPSSPSRTEPTLAQPRGGKVKLPKLTLRKFSGDPTAWTPFWDSYESAIHRNPDLSDIDKFNYLQSLVEHSAAEAIAGLTLSSSNYGEAITVLKKRFGNKQQLINKHRRLYSVCQQWHQYTSLENFVSCTIKWSHISSPLELQPHRMETYLLPF